MPQLSTLIGLNFLAGSKVAPDQGFKVDPGPVEKGLGPYFKVGVSEEVSMGASCVTTSVAAVVAGVTTTCGGLLARSSWLIG